jgi:hypothetical protein
MAPELTAEWCGSEPRRQVETIVAPEISAIADAALMRIVLGTY